MGRQTLLEARPDLAAQWHSTRNGDLKPSDITAGSRTKVWWCCEKGHEWLAMVDSRTQGAGCPICLGYKVLPGYNDLATVNPQVAAQWHPTRNGALTPSDVPKGTHKKVWWCCEKGHEWQATVYNRHRGNGCPVCAKERLRGKKLNSNGSLQDKAPELSCEWHPTKNGDLTPSDMTEHSNQKVWWICSKGHEWEASVSSRTSGDNCPFCSGHRVLPGYNDLATVNPVLAAQWHPTRNGELKPYDVTANSGKKVWWVCEKGHEWQATIQHRNEGHRCPYCAGRKVLTGFNDLATLNPKVAAQWHPTKNGDLTPSDVTAGTSKMVWWLCLDCGYEWEASVKYRNQRTYCPRCEKERRILKKRLEEEISLRSKEIM